jgi:integrase
MSLAAATINRRMRTVVEFLLWATDRQLRPKFLVLQSRSSGRRTVRGPWTSARNLIDSRVGIHRVNPKRLRLPSSEKIELWLDEVRVTHGRARYLACKFILQTGCRVEEAANARVWQLPDPSTIDLDMPARMDIMFGTKGQRSPDDPQLQGKPRSLRFNRSFACELNNYKQLGRKKAVAHFRENNEGVPSSDFLFLDDKTGRPLSKQSIYRAWKNTRTKPIESWTPHLGRHAFACYELLRLIKEEHKLMAEFTISIPRTQFMLQIENLISIYLRPVLGHVDDKTSETYTEWIADHLWVAEHRRDWTNYLEESPEP